ncbi:MAG: hypothetical protein E7269_06425 [Lachnospiraceae bacterium]|nr:hypothetical protein [Lachnospiraceae bacterium]
MIKWKEIIKKCLFSMKMPYFAVRLGIWLAILLSSHMKFMASPLESMGREGWNIARNIGLLLVVIEVLRLQRWERIKERTLAFFRKAGHVFLSVLAGGVDFIARLFSLTKSHASTLQNITNYKDETLKRGKQQKKKKNVRRWKKFNKMTNNEKVRFLYWKKRDAWERAGMRVNESATPKELLNQALHLKGAGRSAQTAEKLVSEYEQVRYRKDYNANEETVSYLAEKI